MKKILSVFVLVLISAAAFAADYTGTLKYTIGGNPGTLENIVVSIDRTGDNLYKVVIKNVDVSPVLGMSMGDLTAENLKGETVDGVTTINTTDFSLTSSALSSTLFTSSDLTVRFNESKAYVLNKGVILSAYNYELEFGENDFNPSSIDSVDAVSKKDVKQIYSLTGARLNTMQKGINILRLADGRTVKVLKK